ncbi:MAG TPA: 4-hydroxy-2-oxoheptanedioate aldolase [Noviherbaspirillum sp.]
MQLPVNHFKRALREGRQQLGLWVTLSHPYSTEIVAGSGFDWLLLDTEHSPNDVNIVLSQLQAVAPYPVMPVVRPAWNDTVLIKRYLDIGAQTLLIPYVQNEAEAQRAVDAIRYAPRGVRGVGGAVRATRFGRIANYMGLCEDELCLLVQVESQTALDNLERIASVDGIDGVFIGPADLAASLGHPGNPGHPQVQKAVEDAIARILTCGKAPGILTTDEKLARRYIELGSLFTAVGVDSTILARETENLAARFRSRS